MIFSDGNCSDYGQVRGSRPIGYWTRKYEDGRVSYFMHNKNGERNSYEIDSDRNGGIYHGELRGGYHKEGYGLMKYQNGDEYDGQWKSDKRHGTGIFKEAATGKI